MFNKNSIRKAVLKVVEDKILQAQQAYEAKCVEIDTLAAVQKDEAFKSAVDSITAKLL